MTSLNPLETPFHGYVLITNSGPDGLAVAGVSSSPQSLRNSPHGDHTAIVNIQRARAIARDEHGWDIASEDELNPVTRGSSESPC